MAVTEVAATMQLTVVRADAHVLDAVSVGVGPGELVAVVGPNGAGKTTLLRALAGDVTPDGGRVRVAGRDPAATPLEELARLRSYLPPTPPGGVVFSVGDVVAMGRHPHRRKTASSNGRDVIVAEAMDRMDVSHLEHRMLRDLSTGEAQRVALARLLVQETPLVLLDEPTSSLDVGHQESVMQALVETALRGIALVVAIHDLNLAAAHADRIVVLSDGRVVADAEPWKALRADLISGVYGQPMRLLPHPTRDCPLVVVVD